MEGILQIRRFLCFPSSAGDVVLQNDNGLIRITDRRLAQFILNIDKNKVRKLNIKSIREDFGEETQRVVEFLGDHGVLEQPVQANFNIEEFVFYSNHSEVSNLVKTALCKDSELYQHNDIKALLDQNINSNSFWFVFLNPYSKKLAKQIRDKFIDIENSYLVISYIYNNCLYIDSIYSADWKTPCHMCQIGWLESELRSSSVEQLNYQEIVDILYQENVNFQVGAPFSALQTMNVATQLLNHIAKYTGEDTIHKLSLDDVNQGFAMDLRTFKSHKDTTMHWELCDCYE